MSNEKNIDPKRNSYSLIEFQNMYGNETACEEALYNLKWPDGYACPDAIANSAV